MIMKKTLVLFIGIFSVLLLAGCAQQGTIDIPDTGTSSQGNAAFTITDAAADMGAVSSVDVTIDNIEVHSEAEGWTTVATDVGTYDLLELKAEGTQRLMGNVSLEEGNYQQIRLDISSVMVTDDDGTHEARLPSGEMRMNVQMRVNANTTSIVTLDFQADESLHVTGNGQYIMAPVIQVQTRENAQVQVDASNRVQVMGGNIQTDVKVGMNENGTVGVGVKIPANANVSVDAGGAINVGLGGNAGANIGSGTDSGVNTNVSGNAAVGARLN